MQVISNQQIRKETKEKALKWLSMGNMEMQELAAKLSQYNDWRMQTNASILRELLAAGIIGKEKNMIFLNKPRVQKQEGGGQVEEVEV